VRIAVNVTAMEPLNLETAAPRSPYVQLGGLYMLARTVDKVRATLPGGNLGLYRMAGFSAELLETRYLRRRVARCGRARKERR